MERIQYLQVKPCEVRLSMQMECGSIALLRTMREELEVMVFNMIEQQMKSMVITTIEPMVMTTINKVMEPVAENLFRKLVKEEREAAEEKQLNIQPTKERVLGLKFLDEVCGPVQTGKELKGIKGDPLKVALVDATGQIVTCGPESSAKVEILLLDANDENSLTPEDFERKIIGEEDKKKKPHFAKNVYMCLKNGVGNLIDLKLAHGKDWTKVCNCSLGVRLVQSIRGVVVQEAWTAPFKVEDKRATHFGKHDRPFLSSDVWRLKKIGRDGKPCKRLKAKNIQTVQDFRFWLSVDPEGLKEILDADGLWKTTVDHSLTCIIDDDKLYLYKSSTQPQLSVIYNTVGELKGVVTDEYRFVPIDNLSSETKDHARELLKEVLLGSAFEQRYKIIFNTTEAAPSLLQEVPYGSTDINQTTDQRVMDPSNLFDPGPSDYNLGSKDMEMEYFNEDEFVMNMIDCPPSPNPMFHYLDYYSCNAHQMYGDEHEPQLAVDPPNKLKRLKEKMSLDHKKHKVG